MLERKRFCILLCIVREREGEGGVQICSVCIALRREPGVKAWIERQGSGAVDAERHASMGSSVPEQAGRRITLLGLG